MHIPTTLAQTAQAMASDGAAISAGHAIDESVLMLVALGVIGVIAIMVLTVVIPVRAHSRNEREREQTKREIAAYVAEGSIPPDEGAKMIKAAEKPVFDMWGKRC